MVVVPTKALDHLCDFATGLALLLLHEVCEANIMGESTVRVLNCMLKISCILNS